MDVMKRKVAWLTKNDLSMKIESGLEKLQKLIMQAKSADDCFLAIASHHDICVDDIEAGGEEAKKDEVPASFSASSSAQRSSGVASVVDKLIATKVKKGLAWVSPLTGETHSKFEGGR